MLSIDIATILKKCHFVKEAFKNVVHFFPPILAPLNNGIYEQMI